MKTQAQIPAQAVATVAAKVASVTVKEIRVEGLRIKIDQISEGKYYLTSLEKNFWHRLTGRRYKANWFGEAVVSFFKERGYKVMFIYNDDRNRRVAIAEKVK